MNADSSPEAVAIIGMAGRFPQAANLAEFWQNLRAGREAVSFFKDDEVQWLPIEHPPRLEDPAFVKARAVLERPEWFDAAFFGMNPREASVIDPQHRVFLECAWEALENAGCDAERYPGAIGVFAGASMNTYLFTNLLSNPGLVENLGFFPTLIANDNDFVPTRVSYKLNLRGPSINVQTACSTSLVAVCLAVQNLLAGRCDMALAGGVSITFPARRGQYHLAGGILSNDGHCRAFSANASGTVLGDGAGVVVLKRLSEALADGDPIRAVIRGTAINNDGSTKIGYTAPSSDGQAEAIALAHAEAGFAPETVSYIEAHGTGTPLGDPIEVEGLKKAFGLKAERGQFCGLGSVKTNIGHLDITAGVAGLIKTVLALEARELPPSLHFDQPNPKIDFAQSPFYVVDTVRPWPRGATPRRAGVSSFGIGGTNAHVALEEAPATAASSPARTPQVLVLSARSPAAVDAATANLAAHLEANPALNFADVAWTLQTGRKAFPHRRVVVAQDGADAIQRLRNTGAAPCGKAAETAPPVAFLFPGQGVQHANMARGLYETEPIFQQCVDECCRLLTPRLGLDLRSLLFPAAAYHDTAASRLNETSLTQPALFVVEYALARLWLSRGVRPAALLGHSLGEYVAACLAGVFSLPDALSLVATRAALMQAQARGAMLAVRLPEAEAAALVTGPIALAAVNAPELCVLSGPTEAIAGLERTLAARGVGAKRLTTSHAFHSMMMDPVIAPFVDALRAVKLRAPQIPCLSNVTGTWLTADQATSPAYWASHLLQTVRFADNVATLRRDLQPVLLEVGPGQALATLARQHPALGTSLVVPSLGRPAPAPDDRRAFAEALGRLWIAGVSVDWAAAHTGARRLRVALPTYPFERQRHWIEPGVPEAGSRTPKAESQQASAPSALDPQPSTPSAVPVASPPSPVSQKARLAALFTELAGHDFTGANASRSFHELGLDSLLLTQVSFALQERFGAHVTMRQLIEQFPSLEKLASHLEGSATPFADEAKPAPAVPEPGADDGELVPLTQAQQEIWYASQMGPVMSAAYNESCTLHLRGPLDEAALRGALDDLTQRHDSLRSTFPAGGGQQRIAPTATPDFAVVDLTDGPAEEAEARLKAGLEQTIRETFDLVNGPLWRVRALRTAPDHHALVIAVHHIICDGWSQGVIGHELAVLYSARRAGRAPDLPPPGRFSDYARQEARRLETADYAAGDYWAGRFADGVPVLELPSDRTRPATRTFAAAHQHRRLQPETAAAIRQLAGRTGATTFTVLLTGFTTLLHRLSGQDDLVVGVPAAPQVLTGLKSLVGHCVNLLPIRSRLAAGQDFASFLQSTQRTTLDGFEHWQHPFASLLRRLNLARDPNRVPLTNVTFNVSRQRGTIDFDGLVVEAASNPKGFVNFDINFNVTETDREFVVDCNYSTELFDADTMARALDRYELVLRAAAADVARPVHRLPFVTDAERGQLREWNRTEKEFPRDQCLHELFEEQAGRTPESTAVVWGTQRWSYRELDEQANRLARRLRRLGVKPETLVAVHASRTPRLLAALLGILKAGGGYVPLDPAYPADRLAHMLDDSRAPIVITDHARAGTLPVESDALTIDLGDDWSDLQFEAAAKPVAYPRPGNLAYVIYTSGSTGRPKGVAIEHRSAVQLAYWGRDAYSAAELAGVLAGTSLCFDLSVFELFVTLSWGGTVILADNVLALPTLPARDEVTLINTVPSAMTELLRLKALPVSVTTVNLAGEPLPVELVDRLHALAHVRRVCDLYGPSEDTTYSTWAERAPRTPATIGRPLPNTQAYLLDRNLELVPPGVPGELCLAGEGLARGYLNQPALTQQKFIRNPLSDAPAARLYRTGDLVRQRPDTGQLEYLGRLDHQVKIRGFRVELGEIEAVLSRHPEVRQSVAVVHEPAPGDRRIAAYFTPATPGKEPDPGELRRHLARELPDYMVPSALVPLAQFTLTASGKIDRRALPAPDTRVPAADASAAPRTLTEEILAEIWCDVLHVPRVGRQDNFFELGGHSLLVTQALARVQQAFEIELPLRLAFEAPTIAGLAEHIERALAAEIASSGQDSESASTVALA